MKTPPSSVPPQTATFASQDNPETAEAPTLHIDWNGWLEKIQALPSESPDWEDIPQFLEVLQQLYENKQQEREERNTQRQRLQATLSNLTTQAEEILTFFEMRDISQWTVEACPLPRVATAVQLSEQLLPLLLEHHEHNQRPAATYAEERLRRQKVENLEKKITGIHQSLAELFILSPEKHPQKQKIEEHKTEAEQTRNSSQFFSETLDEPSSLAQSQEILSQEDSAPEIEIESTDSLVDKTEPPSTRAAVPESTSSEPTLPAPEPFSHPEPPTIQVGQKPSASEEETSKLVLDEKYEEDAKSVPDFPETDESQPEELPSNDLPPSTPIPEQTDQREAASTPTFVKSEVSPSDVLLPGASNPDIREIAFQLQTNPDPETWGNLLWALIAEDALPTAYWLARILPAMNQSCPIPDGLLAAIQAARWLAPNSQAFVGDLTSIIPNVQPFEDEPQKLLGLAAALRTTLLAPSTGIQTWLKVPQSCPSLGNIVAAISTFAYRGRPLRPDDLLEVTAGKQREESLRQTVWNAKAWLEEASKRRTTLKRASDVWRRMMAPDGALRTLLLPVAEDKQRKLTKVRENLQQWKDENAIINRINEIDQELAGKKYRRIEGKIRNRIVQDVQEACHLARLWCECIERERAIQSGEGSFINKTNEVRLQIQEALPEAIPALQELSSPGQPQPIGAAAQCLLRSLEQLRDMFTDQSSQLPSHTQEQQDWFTANTDSLSVAIRRLLLWLPEIPQEENGQIAEEILPQIGPALGRAVAEGRSLQAAFSIWLDKQDYRFAETMLNAFDESELSAKSRAYQEALEGSREGLREAVSETRDAIDLAVVDGINAEECSKHEGIIESLSPDETLYFPPKQEHLNEINTQLREARRVRLKEVKSAWDELQPQLGSQIDRTKLENIQTFVQSNLDRQGTRVVEECIAHLREVVEEGRELNEELFSHPHSRDVLQEFLDVLPQLENSLQRPGMNLRQVRKNIERGSSIEDIRFGETPKTRRDEAVKAIDAWLRLRGNTAKIPEDITPLLNYLGFSLESSTSVQKNKEGKDWVHVQARMSASDLAKPIPQFGSQTYGRYDIVCVWERPGADTLSAWLRDLHLGVHNSVLVFYLGRLTDRQRRDFARRSRNEELVIAVLDEILLVFLAQERDARLPVFLRCTLPFSAVNPYTPFQAANVPPEMFFGRSPMARQLQNSSGSCLVYGGRQLGKSALLQHVRREFHHPEREQYAWVEEIKLIGDQAGSPPETLWARIRERLKESDLLKGSITTDKAEKVMEYIQDVMSERSERRVLMMFDEADNFLDADAKDRFHVVTNLRTLMVATDRRFKVVFAGLHNVQRFQGIPDQPLAHFGTPLLVGPLEPTAAQDLVREPIEALGYRFDDPGTVLRILSYTNYHPGLIQLFCQELLRRLRQQSKSLPYSIAQSDVEAVYLLPHVRESIRERFGWTLALDPRYQAIVWTIILLQIETRTGYAQAYSPVDLLKEVREWWPEGFDRVDSDQLRGLLDEMRGLGVLVRDAEGYYHLRSPNLVRLVGTETDIEDRLLALSNKEPEESFDADSHHALLDDQEWRYSPLAYAQERQLNAARFGVGLVFASDALGRDHLSTAFRHFIPVDLTREANGDYKKISLTEISESGLQQWLKHYLGSHRNYERLILYCSFQGIQENLLETVRIASKVCQDHERSKKRWMRILFVFDPESTWRWLSSPHKRRQEIENQVDVVTFPRRWNRAGIRQRLNQQGKMDSDEMSRTVLKTTGGWPWLLDKLFEHCGAQDDPRPAAENIKQALGDTHSQLFQDFERSLGLNDVTAGILKFIKTQQTDGQEVPVKVLVDLIAQEHIEGSPVLSEDECYAAIECLRRMSCIELKDNDNLLSVEPTVLRLF